MKRMILFVMILLLALTGCSGESARTKTTAAESVAMNVQELYDSMIALENMPEMLTLEPEMQLNFCGIDSADCLQSVVAICADSLRTDEFWLIEAVDEAALERIQNLAQARLTAKAEESVTYSPEQYAIVQKAQQTTMGNYFILLVSPDVDTLAKMVRDANR